MRILLVSDLPPGTGGGAEVHMTRLAEELRRRGDEVDWFSGEVAHRGLRKVFDLWDPVARRSLARVAARFRPDVVHHHNVLRELSASVFGAVRGAAVFLTVHDLLLFGDPGVPFGQARLALERAKRSFDRAVARSNVDVAIGVSEDVAKRLRAARFRRVELMRNFAPAGDPPGAIPVSESTDVFFAGRLSVEKGAVLLAQAFARIAGEHPGARLVFAGEGEQRAAIQAAGVPVEQLVLAGLVPPEEVRSMMARARVVAVPSLAPEGSPLAVIEAALLGRPLVLSDHPGLREFVDESGGGVVVPVGDADALARALDGLLSDPERAAAIGEAGRRVAMATRTPEVAVGKLRAVYAEAVQAKRAGRGGGV